MRSSRAVRVVRGAVVASIATFTALLSHVVAGGDVPGWAGVAAPWVLALMASTLLAGRSLSVIRLGLSVVISQLLFHTLFVMGSPASASASAPATPGMHHHGAMTLLPTGPVETTALCADPLMWAMHATAATLTTLMLVRGERAMRALLRLAHDVRAWARRIVRHTAAVSLPHLPSVSPEAPFWVVRPAARLAAQRRRGPPLAIAL